MKFPRRARVGLGAAAVLLLATACSPEQAGSAVTYTGGRITENTVAAQAAQVAGELGIAPSQELTQATVQRLTTDVVVQAAAEEAQIVVTESDVDAFLAKAAASSGGMQALEEGALRQGIPRAELRQEARAAAVIEQLGVKLAPNGAQTASDQLLGQYLVAVASTLNIQVSPRFGQWQPKRLLVGPPPNDLSKPAGETNPSDQLTIPQQQ